MNDLTTIADAVRNGQFATIQSLIQQALDRGKSVEEVLKGGLSAGMEVVGSLFKEEEIYVPEVLLAARTMQKGMETLEPLLLGSGQRTFLGRILLGTVKGDVHNLGKQLVGIMLKGVGFEVIDAGENVTADKFLSVAVSHGAQIIGMSALLTTTMPYMKMVITEIEKAGMKGRIKTLIGGACVNQEFADDIGADAYGENASIAVEKARSLLGMS